MFLPKVNGVEDTLPPYGLMLEYLGSTFAYFGVPINGLV